MTRQDVLFAMAILGDKSERTADLAGQAFEKWHGVITARPSASYWSSLSLDVNKHARYARLKPNTMLETQSWREMRAALGRCVDAEMVLHRRPDDTSGPHSGFALYNTSFFYEEEPAGDELARHVDLWVDVADAEPGYVALATATLRATVDELMREADGLQASLGRWAYGPPCDGSGATAYEQACGIHGARTGGKRWCRRFLRVVTETVWLGPDLADLVDLGALAKVCSVAPVGRGVRLTLRKGANLDDLERLLSPILPSREDWLEACRRREAGC